MMIITCFSLKIYNACPAKMAFIFMCDINSLHLQNTPNSKQKNKRQNKTKDLDIILLLKMKTISIAESPKDRHPYKAVSSANSFDIKWCRKD